MSSSSSERLRGLQAEQVLDDASKQKAIEEIDGFFTTVEELGLSEDEDGEVMFEVGLVKSEWENIKNTRAFTFANIARIKHRIDTIHDKLFGLTQGDKPLKDDSRKKIESLLENSPIPPNDNEIQNLIGQVGQKVDLYLTASTLLSRRGDDIPRNSEKWADERAIIDLYDEKVVQLESLKDMLNVADRSKINLRRISKELKAISLDDPLSKEIKKFTQGISQLSPQNTQLSSLSLLSNQIVNVNTPEEMVDAIEKFIKLKSHCLNEEVIKWKVKYSELFLKLIIMNVANELYGAHNRQEESQRIIRLMLNIYKPLNEKLAQLNKIGNSYANDSVAEIFAKLSLFFSTDNVLTNLAYINPYLDAQIKRIWEQVGQDKIKQAVSEELVRLKVELQNPLPHINNINVSVFTYTLLKDISGPSVEEIYDAEYFKNYMRPMEDIVKEYDEILKGISRLITNNEDVEDLIESLNRRNAPTFENLYNLTPDQRKQAQDLYIKLTQTHDYLLEFWSDYAANVEIGNATVSLYGKAKSAAKRIMQKDIAWFFKKTEQEIAWETLFSDYQKIKAEFSEVVTNSSLGGVYQSSLMEVEDKFSALSTKLKELQNFSDEINTTLHTNAHQDQIKIRLKQLHGQTKEFLENEWVQIDRDRVNADCDMDCRDLLTGIKTDIKLLVHPADHAETIEFTATIKDFKEKCKATLEEITKLIIKNENINENEAIQELNAIKGLKELLTKNQEKVRTLTLIGDQRTKFRYLYQKLSVLYNALHTLQPRYDVIRYNNAKPDDMITIENEVYSEVYKNLEAAVKLVLEGAKEYVKETQQDIDNKKWKALTSEYQAMKAEFNQFVKNPNITLIDLSNKFSTLNSKREKIKSFAINVETSLSEDLPNLIVKQEIKELHKKTKEFLKSDEQEWSQIGEARRKAASHIYCKDLRDKADQFEYRVNNYTKNPYIQNYKRHWGDFISNELHEFKKKIVEANFKAEIPTNLESELNTMIQRFAESNNILISKIEAHQAKLKEQQRVLSDKLDEEFTIASMNTNTPGLNGIYDQCLDKLVKLSDDLAIVNNKYPTDPEDYTNLQDIENTLSDVESVLSVVKNNFNGLKEWHTLLSEFILHVPENLVINGHPPYQQHLIKFYNLDTLDLNFEKRDLVKPTKDKFKAAILGYLKDIVKNDKAAECAAKFLPFIYDANNMRIRSEYADLFSGDSAEFNTLVAEIVPLSLVAPVAVRGINPETQYQYALMDMQVKIGQYKAKNMELMRHIKNPNRGNGIKLPPDFKENQRMYNMQGTENYTYFTKLTKESEAIEKNYKDIYTTIEQSKNVNLDEFNFWYKNAIQSNASIEEEVNKQNASLAVLQSPYKKIQKTNNIIKRILTGDLVKIATNTIAKYQETEAIEKLLKLDVLTVDSLSYLQTNDDVLFQLGENAKEAKVSESFLQDVEILKLFNQLKQCKQNNNLVQMKRQIGDSLENPAIATRYNDLFQFFKKGQEKDWANQIDNGIIGEELKIIMARINDEIEAKTESITKFNLARQYMDLDSKVEFHQRVLAFRDKILPAYTYTSSVNYMLTYLYSPSLGEEHTPKAIQEQLNAYDFDEFLKEAKEIEQANPYKPKEVKAPNVDGNAPNKGTFFEELRGAVGVRAVEIGEKPEKKKKKPRKKDTRVSKSARKTTVKKSPRVSSDQSLGDEKRELIIDRINQLFPTITVSKGIYENETMIRFTDESKDIFHFLQQWFGDNAQGSKDNAYVFMPKELNVVCRDSKLVSLSVVLEYYSIIRASLPLLQNAHKLIAKHKSKSSQDLAAKILETLTKIAYPDLKNDGLEKALNDLEAANRDARKNKWNSLRLFKNDSYLVLKTTIRQIRKNLKLESPVKDPKPSILKR